MLIGLGFSPDHLVTVFRERLAPRVLPIASRPIALCLLALFHELSHPIVSGGATLFDQLNNLLDFMLAVSP
ncbi:MAG: hypothetical protein B7X11_06075, partial [Acidobacteria bacterium 37-65-4]